MMPATLITGAAARVGKAIALHMAERGHRIAIHYNRSGKAAEALAAELGDAAIAVKADLENEAETRTLVERASSALGTPLTNLINNASLFEEDDWKSADTNLWHRHHQVNLQAPYLLSRAFALQAEARDNPAIINIIDQRVWRLRPDFLSYTLSKSALWTLTQTLAQALAPAIRVNAVGPGPVLQSIHQDAAVFDAEAKATPLETSVDPEEIAQACAYLLNAKKVTGQMIAVDSGQHLAWQTPDVVGPEHD